MAAPATEDLRELERELLMAAESGHTVAFAQLRDMLAVGHDDLTGMLDTLREHGKAIEDAPGEWRGPLVDEVPAPDPVRVVVPSEGAADEAAEAAVEALATSSVSRAPAGATGVNVRLTRAIADRLSDEALGQIVKAGLEDHGDGVFVIEITPSAGPPAQW